MAHMRQTTAEPMVRVSCAAVNRAPLLSGILGLAVVLVAALADPIGIGSVDGFGWKQWVGVGVGVALILASIALAARASRSPQ